MRKSVFGAIAALSLLSFVSAPASAVVTYNASLASPGVYYGTGNGGTNSGWTVDTTSIIELGVGVIERYMGAVAPTATNVYNVPLGNTSLPHQGAWWGFRFSAETFSGPLSDYTFSMSIADVKYGNTVVFDPTAIPDNAGTDGLNVAGGSNGCFGNVTSACLAASRTGMQNAEALSFVNGVASAFDPMYNSGEDNTWHITLSALRNGTPVSSVGVIVNAGVGVMEPASIVVLLVGLIGLACVANTRRRGGTGNGGGGAANDNEALPAAA